MATYVMCVRHDGYWLVGPFPPAPDQGPDNRFLDFLDFGPANPMDDPRWQTVDLDDPSAAPAVLTLEQHIRYVGHDQSPMMPSAEGPKADTEKARANFRAEIATIEKKFNG